MTPSTRVSLFFIGAGIVSVALGVIDYVTGPFLDPEAALMIVAGAGMVLIGLCKLLTGWP